MIFSRTFGFLTVSGLLLFSSSAQASLILNGSFEDPNIPFNSFAIFGSIPGWTTTFGGGIEIQDHVAGSPYDLDQFVELDSTVNSGMIQTPIATVAGTTYVVSFAYSPRPNRSASDNGIEAYFNDVLLISLAADGLSNTSWTVHNFLVTPTGAISSLEFRAVGNSTSFGGYLDAVSVAVPEPSALLLLGTALAAAAYRRRRTK
jgi:hypothetical protein